MNTTSDLNSIYFEHCSIAIHKKKRKRNLFAKYTKKLPLRRKISQLRLIKEAVSFCGRKTKIRKGNRIFLRLPTALASLDTNCMGKENKMEFLKASTRLRIGHTRLTHASTLKQEPQPQCVWRVRQLARLNTFL